MTFNGPPKPPQEKSPQIETPEYWKENLPFKSPRKLYELEFEFAKMMAERAGTSLVEAVDSYAPVIRNHIHMFNEEGDWKITGLEEGVTDENILEYAWDRSLERHVERNSEPTPYHPEGGSRFGCHYYTYEDDIHTVYVHFFNAEFEEEWVDGKDVSKGPLAQEKIERRKHELTDMFRDIKAKHSDAQYVKGRSSLYNLEAYRRLYPESYEVGEIDYDPKLWGQGTTVWGQFLGGNDKKSGEYGYKEELAKQFIEKVKNVPLDMLADALPMPPRKMHGNIQDFYDFYGISKYPTKSVPNQSPEHVGIDRVQYSKFSEEDQKLMKSGEWDHLNPELELNKLKLKIEAFDENSLSEQEVSDRDNALWLWYHHGSQFAYAKYHDTKTAIEFIDKALVYRDKIGLDNQITPLLKMLYTGNLVEARIFAERIPQKVIERNKDGIDEEVDNVEHETGLALVVHFEQENLK